MQLQVQLELEMTYFSYKRTAYDQHITWVDNVNWPR